MGVKFSLNFNVKRKFVVNGKEYSSPDEMPDDVREAYQKAEAARPFLELAVDRATIITFNGVEYESPDAMPADVRRTYDRIMNEIKTGHVPTGIPAGQPPAVPPAGPTAPEPVFSPQLVTAGVLIMLLLGLVCYLLFLKSP